MLRVIFTVLTINLDVFLAAAAYRNDGINIPRRSICVICTFSSAILFLSISLADLVTSYIPVGVCRKISIIAMSAIGMGIILRSISRSLTEHIPDGKLLTLKTASYSLVIRLYLDDTAADSDNSKSLSVREAVALAAASSIDCAAVGMGLGTADIKPFAVSLLTFATAICAMLLGGLAGKKISSLHLDLSWVGGILLIVMAFLT